MRITKLDQPEYSIELPPAAEKLLSVAAENPEMLLKGLAEPVLRRNWINDDAGFTQLNELGFAWKAEDQEGTAVTFLDPSIAYPLFVARFGYRNDPDGRNRFISSVVRDISPEELSFYIKHSNTAFARKLTMERFKLFGRKIEAYLKRESPPEILVKDTLEEYLLQNTYYIE